MMRNTARGHRRSIRLDGYDYASAGAYFVTICTQDRACVFGDVVDGEMRANACGRIVQDELARTPMVRPEMQIDACVVMPNHVHVVVRIVGAYGNTPVQGANGDTPNAGARGDNRAYIDTPVRGANGDAPARGGRNDRAHIDTGAYIDTPLQGASGNTPPPGAPAFRSPSHTIGAMVRGFKSATTARINTLRGTPGTAVWQRNYYEQIIRDEDSLNRVRAYVSANPARWLTDRDNQNPIHGTERRPND
jgi:REP element-mobilizing transposase RayT